MSDLNPAIPYYREINDFLASIPSDYRTRNPDFFCLRLKENEGSINNYKPPFRKGFYFIGLVSNAGKSKITFDQTNVTNLNAFLVFQSPGQLYSFYRDSSASGFLFYFRKDCFSFFKPDFEKEFPYFNLLHTNFFKLNQQKFHEFAPYFEEVMLAYENSTDVSYRLASVKFLALLYQLKDFTGVFSQWEQGFTTPQQILFQKFIQLVNNFYIEKRTIEEYAQMLNITPNHLSQTVKSATGKNALSFINERLLNEAKSLVRFTDFDIAEITYRLHFSDPANFGKFFKKHTGQTPLSYRKSRD